MSASITVTPPFMPVIRALPLQGNWGKANCTHRPQRQGERPVTAATLTFEGLSGIVMKAWAMNDGESNVLIHLLV